MSTAINSQWCEELYKSKASALLLYGRALGLTHSEAEDVLHETFLVLMRLPAEPDKPAHYVMRAFRNRALNFRRSLFRRLAREFETRAWFEQDSKDTALEIEAMKCLQDLPVAQREVVVLKIWHSCTFEEISEIQGASPNTVAGRYRYGMEKLRRCLKGTKNEEQPGLGTNVVRMEAATALPGN